MNAIHSCQECGSAVLDQDSPWLCPKCILSQVVANCSSANGSSEVEQPARNRFGDYELLHEISRGGMGVVYKARQVSLNRTVAVKMLLLGKFSGGTSTKRFLAEAEAAASLRHPNIVTIHEVGEHEGQHYFSMDYVAGMDLASLVREQPLPVHRAAALLKTIAEAIHYAHGRGILHRDLKPSNILIDANDHPRITDFGLAKRFVEPLAPGMADSRMDDLRRSESTRSTAAADNSTANLTVSGQVIGTPHFMPPEQAGGKRGDVTPASDVYSLGAILYHLLTGRPPFLADTLEAALTLLLHSDPMSPRLLNPGVPRDLETICLKCLSKEPQQRYVSAQALADDLGRLLRGEPVLARPISAPGKLWRWCRRKPALSAALAVVALLLIAVTFGSIAAAIQINQARNQALIAENIARQAQAETTEKLWDSYVAQARANRRSGLAGQRFDTLDIIEKAAAIKTSSVLRDEAVAALALPDARRIYQRFDRDGEDVVVAFDPERRRYTVALPSGEISVRSTDSSSELLHLPAVGSPVAGIQGFSNDGRRLMAVYQDQVARVWDLVEGRVRLTVKTTVIQVSFSAVLSADGRFLAATDGSKWVNWYDVETGRLVSRIATAGATDVVEVTRNGDRMAVAKFGEERVEVFAMPSGELLATLKNPSYVRKLSWDLEGRRLAVIGGDRVIRVWDLESRREPRAMIGHNEDVDDVVFSRTENLLISSGWDGTCVWNCDTGEQLLTLPEHGARVGLSENGRWLYRQPYGRFTHELWELVIGEPMRVHGSSDRRGESVRACAFSRDQKLLVDADSGLVRVYDPLSGRELGSGRIAPAVGLAFDAGLNLWASGAGGLQFIPVRFDSSSHVQIFGPPQSVGLAVSMERLRMSGDGWTLAVSADDRFRVFDARTRREIFATPEGSGQSFLAISPDGKLLATTAWGAHSVQIWDVGKGQLVTKLHAEAGVTDSAEPAFSPDGHWLVTVGWNGCTLWNVQTWERRWTRPRADLPLAMYSPGGDFVLHRDHKAFLELLSASTGSLLGRIEMPRMTHPDGSGAAFSPEGTFLALHPMGTRELFVWNLASLRKQLARLGLDWELPPIQKSPPAAEPVSAVRFVEQ